MSNRLAQSSSPYLRQHKDNPVDWYPWGDEALQKARTESKPIFLSIGYSSCHWCHVMERESFSNADVARVLNEHYVPIKVDREERPDLDHLYMQAVQMMTGSGGWPLNVFLTPDLRPFFGGTYFPLEAKYGKPPFRDLLERIVSIFYSQADEVKRNSDQLTAMILQEGRFFKAADTIDDSLVQRVLENVKRSIDKENGGLGGAPKFFHTSGLRLLLRKAGEAKNAEWLSWVELSLSKMSRGGVYDQIGGGFHRYSTDAEWKIPHFEKMLYDNGLLVPLYVELWVATKNDFYKRVAEECLEWALREMKSNDGGFYSAIDADSEHEEGKFYRWELAELRKLLSEKEFDQIQNYSDFIDFEGHIVFGLKDISTLEQRQTLKPIFAKLLEERNKREWPLIDKKILTSWNGLMISALSYAGKVFGRSDFLDAARSAADSILKNARLSGRLIHSRLENVTNIASFLEDYAYVTEGLLDLYEATSERRYFDEAASLTSEMISEFFDNEAGGFWSTRSDQLDLLIRAKEIHDGAVPSAYQSALSNILRIYSETPSDRFFEVFKKSTSLILGSALEAPGGFSRLALVIDDYLKANEMACHDGVCERPPSLRQLSS